MLATTDCYTSHKHHMAWGKVRRKRQLNFLLECTRGSVLSGASFQWCRENRFLGVADRGA